MGKGKCQVCFRKTRKIHKKTCGRCKAFFFRTAVFNEYSTLICQQGESCQIGHGKNSCKKCRYERYLKLNESKIEKDENQRVITNDDFNVDLDTLQKDDFKILADEETERLLGIYWRFFE